VRAIAVAAGGGQFGDLIEGPVHRVFAGPKLEFAHARSVDQRASPGQRDEFPVRGGMASAAVGFAHLRRAQAILAEQRFTSDDLPTPDDPTSATVRPSARYGSSALDALGAPRVHRHHGRGAGDGRRFGSPRRHVAAEVALIQHHDRTAPLSTLSVR
jgi:hypothetical protein